MKCPVCDTDLRAAEREGIEIDYCPHCYGVWLAQGELQQIIERSNPIDWDWNRNKSMRYRRSTNDVYWYPVYPLARASSSYPSLRWPGQR